MPLQELHNILIDIQPKGTPLGTKIEIEENGEIVPTFTLDTKKMREQKKIDAKQILDNALEDFLDEDGV